MLGDSLDRIWNLLDAIRSRLWFIPAVTSILAAVAARAMVDFDNYSWFTDVEAWWYFGGDSQTARDMLSTLLSGMITMTSLVISITMVVLSLAANQLGPRLIWNFIRDRQIQMVIGLFFGTITFILVVTRSVQAESVPAVAVTLASALVGLCLFALLFHISKVARSIIADTVVDDVARELSAAVAGLPDYGSEEEDPPVPSYPRETSLSVGSSGYVQVIEYRRLTHIAARHDLTIELQMRAGHFVLRSGEYIVVRSKADLGEDTAAEIRSAVLVGSQRTPTQDVEYSIRQLVEIAVRAMSPGVNDPFTCIMVVHRLSEAIDVLMSRSVPERIWYRDEAGLGRVLGETSTFRGLVDAAFNQIRQAATARGNAAVLISLVSGRGKLGAVARNDQQSAAVLAHMHMVGRAAHRVIEEENDIADFDDAYGKAVQKSRPAG